MLSLQIHPPFNATEEGLETVFNERPNLKFNAGNIVFDQLSATFPTATKITTVSTTPVNRKIDIKTPLSYNHLKY